MWLSYCETDFPYQWETEQSDSSDFDGDTHPISLSKDKNWLGQCHSICLPSVNNFAIMKIAATFLS